MEFQDIFNRFLEQGTSFKVLNVASADKGGLPNSAAKMLVDIKEPNRIYLLEYKFTKTYLNLISNPHLSLSFLDDTNFTGYRLTGSCEILAFGEDYEEAKAAWQKRAIAYEADRIVKRVTGEFSTRDAENNLPNDFVIVKFTANEGAVVKPDRVFRAQNGK